MGCCIGFFYNPIKNLFVDTDGFVVYEIFRLVSPGQLLLFKKNKKDMTIPFKGDIIQLYWTKGEGLTLNHNDETMDVGDDMERIERYERGKWYMNY
jgi:hypothetical protein